jgi:electron transfer flavoprotein alpha subunit
MSMKRKVLVLTEARGGFLRNVSFEMVTTAKQIADGGEVIAVLFGTQTIENRNLLGNYGATELIQLQHESLNHYTPDAYVQAVTSVISELNPDVILAGHTAAGKDYAPRVAAKLALGLVSDVVEIEVEGEDVLFKRPIYAGKAFQVKKVTAGAAFATVRPNNLPATQGESRVLEPVPFSVEIKDLRTIIKDVVRKAVGGVDLSEARVVVSGGRGVKSSSGFAPLQELANVLGGAVGASRGACDAEYCDYSLQIGQTGKVVTPDLYIACGISGAIQHLAGMSSSKVIIAINKDPEAPIFQVADYGIVGDLFEVVPLLTEEFKRVLELNK